MDRNTSAWDKVGHSRTSRWVCRAQQEGQTLVHRCFSVTCDSPDHTVHALPHRRSWGEPGGSHHQGQPGHPVCRDTVSPALTQCGPRHTPDSVSFRTARLSLLLTLCVGKRHSLARGCIRVSSPSGIKMDATSGIHPRKLSAESLRYPASQVFSIPQTQKLSQP